MWHAGLFVSLFNLLSQKNSAAQCAHVSNIYLKSACPGEPMPCLYEDATQVMTALL